MSKIKKVSIPESSSEEETGYIYLLVEFCESPKTGLADIDVIPASWCIFDKNKDICTTRYPSPPYTKKVCQELQNLVKTTKSPPTDWPLWDILIKGGADTYAQAIKRVKKLTRVAYAFTTDGEIDGPTKAAKATAAQKKKTTKELFCVADVNCNDGWSNDFQADSVVDKNNNSGSSTEDELVRWKPTSVQRKKKSTLRAAPTFANHGYRIMREKKIGEEDVEKEKDMRKREDKDEQKERQRENEKNEEISSRNLAQVEKNLSTDTLQAETTFVNHGYRIVREKKIGGENVEKEKEKRKKEDEDKQKERQRKNEKDGEIVSRNPAQGEKNLSTDTLFLLKILKGLSLDIQANSAAINALCDRLGERETIGPEKCTVQNLETAHGIQLPFQDQESFSEFEKNLQGDEKLHETLTSSLKQYLDRNNNLTKSLSNVLRKFFSKEIAMKFTAKKKVEGKTLLKNTAFGSCLIAAMMKFHTLPDGTPVNEDLILKSAGAAISNAKDWDGRKGRGKED